jgi:hypothetical protein
MLATHDTLGRRKPDAYLFTDTPYRVEEDDFDTMLEPSSVHGLMFTSYFERFGLLKKNDGLGIRKRVGGFATSTNIRWNGVVGGPLLIRPRHERPSRNMTRYYELSPRGIAIVKATNKWRQIPHGGWWKHQIANACVTASLHIGVAEDEKLFSPMTGDLGRVIDYEAHGRYYDKHRLVPDFGFCVDYGQNLRRYFMVETDLGNELPTTERVEIFERRKTFDRMAIQYARLIGHALYYDLYGIPHNKALLALFVTSSEAKLEDMKQIIQKHLGTCAYILLKCVPPDSFSPYKKPQPLDLWDTPWERVGYPAFYLNNPARQ